MSPYVMRETRHHEESKHDDDSSSSYQTMQTKQELHNEESKAVEGGEENEADSPPQRDYDPTQRVYSYEQLQVLNLVVHPIWIFDYIDRRMRWANDAGLKMWNATSLHELQQRNFQDISAASAKRMEEYLVQFEHGKNVTDQWTNYPNGKATTCHMNVSGIKFEGLEDHFCIMCEGVPLVKEELLQANLRGVEMIRHLPMAVCQFDMDGKCMFQNPEASLIQTPGCTTGSAGSTSTLGTSETSTFEESKCAAPGEDDLDGSTRSCGTEDSHNRAGLTGMGSLLQRFVDAEVGRQVLHEIQSEISNKVDVEAMVHTRKGPKWSAIQLRKGKDPVTGESIILYSANDKTDRIRAQKEREAREQKSEFLAIMAHEIRTPLHQVTGFIDLLDQTTLDAEQKSFVRLLKSSAQGLMTVISDVLDYSKLEAGKMKLECIPYEPLSVVEGTLAAVRTSCEEKELYLKLDWHKGVPFKLKGDPNRLRQILLNLLSNAVKFTQQGGISVRASSTFGQDRKPMVRFEVSDTGMGISDDHKKVIFRKYQQANAAIARNFGGTGLGLSICQLLVQNMGGEIGVESESGHGAMFWVHLPAEVPAEVDSPEPAETGLEHFLGSMHILIAEDNKVNQKLLANMLKRMGHTSDVAMNGKQAIEMVEQGDYDLVLMDIQMPVMDGLEATRRLRTMGYSDLPIYGLTASVARNDYQDLGLNDWIAKPIPMKDLKAKLYQLQLLKGGEIISPENDWVVR